jgi:hypothetical protein
VHDACMCAGEQRTSVRSWMPLGSSAPLTLRTTSAPPSLSAGYACSRHRAQLGGGAGGATGTSGCTATRSAWRVATGVCCG